MIQDYSQEIPFSQLGRSLTVREEAQDGLAVELGLRPQRRLMPSSGTRIGQASVNYVWPSQCHPHPRRSSH